MHDNQCCSNIARPLGLNQLEGIGLWPHEYPWLVLKLMPTPDSTVYGWGVCGRGLAQWPPAAQILVISLAMLSQIAQSGSTVAWARTTIDPLLTEFLAFQSQ